MITNLTWQTKLIAIIALCVISFAAGWRVHGWKTDAGVTRSIAKAEMTRQSIEKKQAVIVQAAAKQEVATRIIYRTIREKINDQNDQSVCFSNESLKLWNDAITANTDSHRRNPASGSGAVDPATRENESGADYVATVEQVLINASDNFETCTRNSNHHLALIEAVRGINDKMCVCR